VPLAEHLGALDPEPDMATLSLFMFGSMGAVATVVSYISTASLSRRAPGILLGLATGALASVSFFAALALVRYGLNLWIALLAAFTAAVLLAAIAPRLGPTVSGPNQRLERP
jgi:hypothetical protein